MNFAITSTLSLIGIFLVYFFNQVIITKKKKKKEINSYQYIYVLIFALDINPTILKLLILGDCAITQDLLSRNLYRLFTKRKEKIDLQRIFF